MSAVAARRSGVSTPKVRVSAGTLAAAFTSGGILLLVFGLTLRNAPAELPRSTLVDFIPVPPQPEPPPQPEVRIETARASTPAPAPAPQPLPAGAPPLPMDATVTPVAAPAAPPAASEGSGAANAGSGTGGGNGTEDGGAGRGGTGAGAGTPGSPAFVGASWVTMPGTPELTPFNPPKARIEQVNGRVLLKCNVLASRQLANCRVVREAPRGYWFGRAALAASRTFRVNPPTRGGVVLDKEWVEIPVSFNNRRPREAKD